LSPAVLGREAEILQLAGLASRTAAGHGAAVLIDGEAGIGKTTLLDVLAAECVRSGIHVLRAAAHEMEQRLPFSAIGACLQLWTPTSDTRKAGVAALLRGDGVGKAAAPDAANRDFLVTEEMLELVDQWCAQRPLALMLDDLQWSDSSSLLVLYRLIQQLGQLPLLVVASTRPLPQREELVGLRHALDARGATTVRLGPLDDGSVAQLVQNILGAPASPELSGLVAAAAGNPLYVTELVAALSRQEGIQIAGGIAQVADRSGTAGVPPSLSEAILRRLDFLSPESRQVLQVAAVLGPDVGVRELSAVLDRPFMELMQVVREALVAGLLAEVGEKLVFRHDLIRQALAEHLPASLRMALQLHAGKVLAAAGAPVEQVAQLLMAGGTLDTAMLDWVVRSADPLIVRAPALAVELLGRALALGAPTDERRPTLQSQLVRALLWAGQSDEAKHAATAALAAGPDETHEITLRWLLAQVCFQQGELEQAAAEAERALASPQCSPADEARFLGLIAQCSYWLNPTNPRDDNPARALAAAQAAGDRYATAYGLYILASKQLLIRHNVAALELVDQAVAALRAEEIQPDRQMAPHLIRGFCLEDMDRFEEAGRDFDTGQRQCERGGGGFQNWYHMAKAQLGFLAGRWDDALAEIQAGLAAVDSLGLGHGLRSQAAQILVHRGDHQTYAALVEQPDDSLAGHFCAFHREWARALTWEAQGRPDDALELLVASWRGGVRAMPQASLYYLCPDIARLAAMLADDALLREVAVAMDELNRWCPSPGIRSLATLCRGLLDGDRSLLAEATAAPTARPLFQAYAHESAAVVLARQGSAADARTQLDAALAVYDGLDATWDVARAEDRLKQEGVRRGRRGSRGRPQSGWDALTDTESRVAALVAEGRTNSDIATHMFLSRRTVQSHVSNVLMKLSLSSRAGIAVEYMRHAR
jgi:DNA-binding CsgD family transcriptional regulator